MDTRLIILRRLEAACRERDLGDTGHLQWADGQRVRDCTLQLERGDEDGWRAFLAYFEKNRDPAREFRRLLEEIGWVTYVRAEDRLILTLPDDIRPMPEPAATELLRVLWRDPDVVDAKPAKSKQDPGTIMYIEEKPGLTGHARIGRVRFSASRKTIYYAGRTLRSLKGAGYKANYVNVDSGLQYWISHCKKDGNDTLYPGIVEIDENAREEYWTHIRQEPENVHLTKFRSEGKYSRRRPC